MMSPARNKRNWSAAIAFSLALHGLLVAAAVFVVIRYDANNASSGATSRAGGAGGDEQPAAGDEQAAPTMSSEHATALLQQQIHQASKRSGEENMARLEKKMDDLSKVDPGSADSIASMLEAAGGVDSQRAWTPRSGAGGAFDPQTAVLHTIRRRETKDGVFYDWMLVDAAGRSMTYSRPESQMSEQDLRSFRIFEMSRENPTLRRLVEAAVRLGSG
jgi:hypothetical protein